MDDPRLDYFDGTVLYHDPADDMDYVGSEWDFRAPTLAEEHAFWHLQRDRGIIDAHTGCPLDCGEHEGRMAEWEQREEGNITCGHCKARERSIEHVRECGR